MVLSVNALCAADGWAPCAKTDATREVRVETLAGIEMVHTWTFYVAKGVPSSEHDAQSTRMTAPVGPDGKPCVLDATAWLETIDRDTVRMELQWFNLSREGKRIPIEPIVCAYATHELQQVWKGLAIRVSYVGAD